MTTFKSGETAVGTTWPYQVNLMAAEKPPVTYGIEPKEGTTGWSDTWMISSKAAHPNCMYLWMDYIISPEANAKVAEYFGEAPSNAKSCDLTTEPDTARSSTRRRGVVEGRLLLDTPKADCGDDRGEVCKTYEDWRAAWTDIKG